MLGQKVYQALPHMMSLQVTPANMSDITVATEMLSPVRNITLFADKAYARRQWEGALKKQGIQVYTPVKLEKGRQYLGSADNFFPACFAGKTGHRVVL
jgi:hypothetical protein